jgi:hypothetical protein
MKSGLPDCVTYCPAGPGGITAEDEAAFMGLAVQARRAEAIGAAGYVPVAGFS